MLLRSEARQGARLHRLQPRRAAEQHREGGDEEHQEEPEPAVDRVPARAAHQRGGSSTYVVCLADTRPSRVLARAWISGAAFAVENREASAAFCSRREARSRDSWSSLTFSWSTATFSATSPASTAAAATIQTTPLRRGSRRRRARGRGRRRSAIGGASVYATAGDQDATRSSPCLWSHLHRHAQLRRARTRVLSDLLLARAHWAPRQRAENRLVAAHAHGEIGRARAPALAVAHELLDEAVLERVEADHREASARTEHRESGRERTLERAELVVHGDAQRLEDALGGMPVAEARRSGDRGLDDVDELRRRVDRAPPQDRARDLPRVPLLAVALEYVGELSLRLLVHEPSGGERAGWIHAHVERRVRRVREAARRHVELHRRDAQIQQYDVGFDAVRREPLQDEGELAAEQARLQVPEAALEVVEVR